ncbi:MAG: phosphoribosyltransferase family protein [Chloroflexota bacterium]
MVDNPRGFQRNEVLTWEDVDKLVDVLIPQLQTTGPFDAMVLITRGGVIPGGMLAEILNIKHMLTAAVDFPSTAKGVMAWPTFLQFPESSLLQGRRTLIVDDVWGSGRTSTAVRGRVQSAGATPFTCVFHYNPYRSRFSQAEPDFYGAVTDAFIVYPWEIDRGMRGLPLGDPLAN